MAKAEKKFAFQLAAGLATNVLIESKYIKAGYIVVADETEFNDLTISSATTDGVIVEGSLVYVSSTKKSYRYLDGEWQEGSSDINTDEIKAAIGVDSDNELISVKKTIYDNAADAKYSETVATVSRNTTIADPYAWMPTAAMSEYEFTIEGVVYIPTFNASGCTLTKKSTGIVKYIAELDTTETTTTYTLEFSTGTLKYQPTFGTLGRFKWTPTGSEELRVHYEEGGVITTIKDAIQSAAGDSTYTNANPSTVAVGGITKGSTFDKKSTKEMWDALLYPYVPFTFSSFATTDSSGTFEYGTTKSITAGTPTFTKGSKDITSIKITDGDGTELYSGTTAASGTAYTLTTSSSWDGLSNKSFTCTLSDGSTTLDKTVEFKTTFSIYYAVTSSNTTVPTAGTKGNEVNITHSNGNYIWFFSKDPKTAIQQYAVGQWNDMTTTSKGKVTFTLSSGATYEYYAYVGPELTAGSGKYRIN